jgi:peptidyl-prolyl cis-trans isomerase D
MDYSLSSKEKCFMLDIMRKNASSLMIKIIFGIIVIVFIFWGVGNFQDSSGDRVALVNGTPISFESYRAAYNKYMENLKSQYGSNLSPEILKMFRVSRTVIDSLITRELLMQAAVDMGIKVTDAELAADIQGMEVFKVDGVFNSQQYARLLQYNNLSQEMFEIDKREEILTNKLYTFITSGIKVTDGEIEEWYEWINASVDIEYALFSPYSLTGIEPTEEALGEFYNNYSENYRTKPKVSVRYMVFRPENYTGEAVVDDSEIQAYYDGNISEFAKEKTVEARHILLSVDENAAQDAVDEKLKKAEEILAMAKAGKDFSELAKEYSEGTTRETGGLLGEFKKGDMVAPFSEAAFSMEEGEISDPVRTRFGWHLIKVEKVNEASVQKLEDVALQIRERLTEDAAREIAFERADAAFDQALGDDDFVKTAADLGIELKNTDFFTSAGPETGISDPRAFANAAFEVDGTEISDVLTIGDNYYILQKTGEVPSEIPDLSVVKKEVEEDLLSKMKDEKALKSAEEFLASVKIAGDLGNAASAQSVEVESSGFFKRSDTIPGVGEESEIINAVFSLSDDNKIADQVFKGSAGYYVVQLKSRKSPDMENFETQKESIKSQLVSQKQQTLFNKWLETLMAESDITIEEGYSD